LNNFEGSFLCVLFKASLQLIGVEGARLLWDRRAGETLKSKTFECGSPPAPRKASICNGDQPLKVFLNKKQNKEAVQDRSFIRHYERLRV
jgi:hypothetical protein